MKSNALVFLVLLTLSGGSVMAEPTDQDAADHIRNPDGWPSISQDQLEITPAQRVAQDFQALAQDHATLGAASSR